MIARDSKGKMMVAKARTFIQHLDSELAEVRAAVCAMQLAVEYRYKKVSFEGDALLIIKALQGASRRSGYVQLLVEDALAIASNFDQFRFEFCYRECNEVAHRLAKWAVSSFCDEVWLSESSSWLSDVLILDLIPIS